MVENLLIMPAMYCLSISGEPNEKRGPAAFGCGAPVKFIEMKLISFPGNQGNDRR